MSDALRQSNTDKAASALKPDSQKSYVEQAGDQIKGAADSVAGSVQPNSQKGTGQAITDTLGGKDKSSAGDKADSTLNKASNSVSNAFSGAGNSASDAGNATRHEAGKADPRSADDKTLLENVQDAVGSVVGMVTGSSADAGKAQHEVGKAAK